VGTLEIDRIVIGGGGMRKPWYKRFQIFLPFFRYDPSDWTEHHWGPFQLNTYYLGIQFGNNTTFLFKVRKTISPEEW